MKRTRDESADSSEGSAVLQGDMLRSVRQRRAKTARLVASEAQQPQQHSEREGNERTFCRIHGRTPYGTYNNTDNTIA